VGRRGELARLVAAFERVAASQSPAVVNVLGPAGIGKSRLVAALADEVEERARVVSGRCLSYGDGIAFWPLAEIIRGLGGEPAVVAIARGIDGGATIATHVLALAHAGDSSPSEETFWAVRRVLEAAAQERPLVVVVEDVHWARPTLLDLLEYLVGWLRGAPILLVCVARPELSDVRATWTQPGPNVETVTLEPLSTSETETLLEGLARGATLDPEVRARIVEAAEGNPLFVEQLAAMVADEPSATETRVPPSIQALLAERLDRLPADERAVLERAAVMGRTFWRAAVVDLSPEEERPEVGRHLLALVRRELLRPGASTVPKLDAFEFRHALIRDAAYEGMSRAARARLHERFASWIDSNLGAGDEHVEEIVGYHLEQAFRHRVALAPMSDPLRALGRRAGLTLAAAGQRAHNRGDAAGAVSLLARAVSLLGPEDPSTLPDLGLALSAAGRPDDAEAVLGDAIEAARAIGDRRLEATAEIARAHVGLLARSDAQAVMPAFRRALPVLEAAGDERGQAGAWQLVAINHFMHCELAAMDDALARAAAHARAAGAPGEQRKHMARRAMALALGPAPVEEAIETCRGLLRVVEPERLLTALVGGNIATLQAMRGDFASARAELEASGAILRDFGPVYEAGNALYAGPVELLAGDAGAAVAALRAAFERLVAIGERGALPTVAAFLARALREQGALDEAERFVEEGRRVGARHDLFALALRTATEATLLAARGASSEAERLAAEAVAAARRGDALNLAATVLVDQSTVLAATRGGDAWKDAAREALALYERKGNAVSAAALRAALSTPPPY
jgi:tetratricopeptide (TPR) repeat protein